MPLLNLGVHVSAAGSLSLAPARAHKLKTTTMQIFARNPRQWRQEAISEEEITQFKAAVKKEKINPVVIHISYILNLAAAKDKFYAITIHEFTEDLSDADRLGAQYLVTHPGSHKDLSLEEGISRVANALAKTLEATPDVKTMILLENTAGSGQWLGSNFKEMHAILAGVQFSPRVGLCLDTAHAWGAGYKIDEPKGFEALLAEIDSEIGLNRLKVIHLNDTKVELASHVDRHADIGSGNIGKKGFEYIVNHKALKNVAFIMETPKESDADDIRNIKTVRKLFHA